MKIQTSLLLISGIFAAAANVAIADTAPDILGSWTGTHENTDPANSAFGEVNPMVFVVESEVGTTISGDFDWLSGPANGCTKDPCMTTWSGTISPTGQLSIVGQYGDDYLGTLVGNTISGTFSGPNGGNVAGYGTWDVTKAPEISPAAAVSALTLLVGGLLVVGDRRRSFRTQASLG
jgi:hypothetical protein